jgi:hypothetical protein
MYDMTQDDRIKLLNAVYRIIRSDDMPSPRIKTLTGHKVDGVNYVSAGDWCTLENFDTKAARNRRMAELLRDEKTISD